MTTTMEVRGKHRVVFLVTYRAALVLLVGVLGAFLLGGWRLQVINDGAIDRANAARCEAGNDFRANDFARWTYLLQLAPPMPNASAADKELRAKFVGYITKADARVDCAHL